jgi:hypothetical protein
MRVVGKCLIQCGNKIVHQIIIMSVHVRRISILRSKGSISKPRTGGDLVQLISGTTNNFHLPSPMTRPITTTRVEKEA